MTGGEPLVAKDLERIIATTAAIRPRPEIASYNQLSLAISSAVHRALAQQVPVTRTLTSLNSQLSQILRKS